MRGRRGDRRTVAALGAALLLAGPAWPQSAPPPPTAPTTEAGRRRADEAEDLVNALLGALLGGENVDGPTLQREVEQAGGVPFKRDVPVAFLSRAELAEYVRELFDAEYPPEQADADRRLLEAFDLLPPGTQLRELRARVLEENVAGFYDERPDRRRLYAVSEDQRFTAMNQLVLVHELRHALQDQYAELSTGLPDSLGDFDDRRLAFLALLEGDATLVMERFVRLRLGGLAGTGDEAGGPADASAGLAAAGLFDVPGAPPVVRDQLVQPYLAGLSFARALWARGGPEALRDAWARPPASTEQVLHPERFHAREAPRVVVPAVAPPAGATLLSEGVLGELLVRSLLGEGGETAAAGWGGDSWRLWDVGGRTLLAWRSEWDTTGDADEFDQALRARFSRARGAPSVRAGWDVHARAGERAFALRRDGDAVSLVSADERALLEDVLFPRSGSMTAAPGADLVDTLDFATEAVRVFPAEPGAPPIPGGPVQGGVMATSTPGGTSGTNLGMAPNLAGLLCYVPCCIGLIFSIVAAIVEKQSRFVRFHAFQGLLLNAVALVIGIGLNVAQAALGFSGLGFVGLALWAASLLIGLGFLALSILLMVKANSGQELELPVIGPMARQWV